MLNPSTSEENHINHYTALHLHNWRDYRLPNWGYSISEEELDAEKSVKASAREIRVSPKSAREVCRAIKGMMLVQAKRYLRDVLLKKRSVPFRRFKKKLGHRRGLDKAFAGRYPVKAVLDLELQKSQLHFLGLREGAPELLIVPDLPTLKRIDDKSR